MLEEFYLKELKEHEAYWQQMVESLREKAKKEQNELAELQKAEFLNTEKSLADALSKRPIKFSTAYLDLKQKEAKLKQLERF
jgi:uncharacterized NAD(P)/FAD-binding protein YdhS